ncbi:unnamed protein product [Cylicocyclus nassatus]|uniref:Uncharacterized protein n=1 Tax=Cylicocyclus nassatus TaxID=53992 RepID=A0AA36GR26_CYLNA|nr:unnamed protein product [Cylicocyclus nassatus]
MDYHAALPSNNFSAIARRLLLKRPLPREDPPPHIHFIPSAGYEPKVEQQQQQHTAIIAALAGDKKTSNEENAIFNPKFVTGTSSAGQNNDIRLVEVEDVKPPVNADFGSNVIKKEDGILMQNGSSNAKSSSGYDPWLCALIKDIAVEKLAEVNSDESCRPVLGKRSRIMIRRVRLFFEELKKILGNACEGTILTQTVELTAWACGVSPDVVTKVGSRDEFVYELLPRADPKPAFTKEQRMQNTLIKYGGRWGDIVRDLIENKLPKDGMTLNVLYAELKRAYVDFQISRSTLHRFIRALGYKLKQFGEILQRAWGPEKLKKLGRLADFRPHNEILPSPLFERNSEA